jgi:hypothetical protein
MFEEHLSLLPELSRVSAVPSRSAARRTRPATTTRCLPNMYAPTPSSAGPPVAREFECWHAARETRGEVDTSSAVLRRMQEGGARERTIVTRTVPRADGCRCAPDANRSAHACMMPRSRCRVRQYGRTPATRSSCRSGAQWSSFASNRARSQRIGVFSEAIQTCRLTILQSVAHAAACVTCKYVRSLARLRTRLAGIELGALRCTIDVRLAYFVLLLTFA